jgi:hypothetical protein
MAERQDLTAQELEAHLLEQLEFLEASADAYDNGRLAEAKRIAVVARVLCHESRTSHALLSQLGRHNGQYLSTAIPHEPTNMGTHSGLTAMGIGGEEQGYFAPLDDTPLPHWLPFDEWWTETVVVDDRRNRLSRRDLVLTAANQDGGAHVDPSLDERYARITKENSLAWVVQTPTGSRPIPNAEKAALRQIGHELLRTFRPNYRKSIERKTEVIMMGGMSFNAASAPPIPVFPVVGRNDPCPCGSGRKFKKCHGAVVR